MKKAREIAFISAHTHSQVI